MRYSQIPLTRINTQRERRALGVAASALSAALESGRMFEAGTPHRPRAYVTGAREYVFDQMYMAIRAGYDGAFAMRPEPGELYERPEAGLERRTSTFRTVVFSETTAREQRPIDRNGVALPRANDWRELATDMPTMVVDAMPALEGGDYRRLQVLSGALAVCLTELELEQIWPGERPAPIHLTDLNKADSRAIFGDGITL